MFYFCDIDVSMVPLPLTFISHLYRILYTVIKLVVLDTIHDVVTMNGSSVEFALSML